MRRPRRPIVALLVVVPVLVAGCGDDAGPPLATPVTPPADEFRIPPDTDAVELRGRTAALLEEQVLLIDLAVRSGARAGFDSPLFRAARRELEHLVAELSRTVSPMFPGAGRPEEFRRLWSDLVDHAIGYGRSEVLRGPADKPYRRLVEETIAAIATLLADESAKLSYATVSERLGLAFEELLVSLDRLGDTRGQLAHAVAAGHRIRGFAGPLAAAIAAADPAVAENTSAEPARLHADLRTFLEEDFLLSFGAIQVGIRHGYDSALFRTASLQVDESAKTFADRFDTIPGVQVHQRVLGSLRRHWFLLVRYARAVEGDLPEVDKKEIERALHEEIVKLSAVLAASTAITFQTIFEPLDEADKHLVKAIEALVKGEPTAYEELVKALEELENAADVLTDGVVRAANRDRPLGRGVEQEQGA